jgi:hypothetical protein
MISSKSPNRDDDEHDDTSLLLACSFVMGRREKALAELKKVENRKRIDAFIFSS